jgi:hypothetical protein
METDLKVYKMNRGGYLGYAFYWESINPNYHFPYWIQPDVGGYWGEPMAGIDKHIWEETSLLDVLVVMGMTEMRVMKSILDRTPDGWVLLAASIHKLEKSNVRSI